MQHAESAEVAPVAVSVLGRETHFAPIGWSPGVARSHGLPEPTSALRDAGYRHSDGLSGRRADAVDGEIPAGGDTTRRGQATRTRERAVQPVDQRIASARGDASVSAAGIAARSADPAPVGAQIFSAIVQTASAANGVEASAPRTAPYGQAVSQGTGNFAPPVRVLRLALAPVELGHVTITLKGHAASLHISIEAERPETAARVESEREALTMRLHEQGYAIEDVAVARSQPVATEPGAPSRERQEPSARDLAGGMRGSGDQGTTGQHGGMGDGARSGMDGSPDRHDRTARAPTQPPAVTAETTQPTMSGQRTGSYSVRRSL